MARVVWIALLVVVATIPVVVIPGGRDIFTLPKELAFETGMLIVAALAVAGSLFDADFAALFARNRGPVIFASAVIVWIAVASMTSRIPAVSREAPLTAALYGLLFVAGLQLAAEREMAPVIGVLLLPAIINSTIVLLQAFHLWQPFLVGQGPDRVGNIGLIGNANTVGTYLVLPTIVALAAAQESKRYRAAFIAATVLLVAAVFWAQTLTVLISLALGLLAFVARAPKRIRIALALLILAGGAALLAKQSTRERLQLLRGQLSRGELLALTSGRIAATGTALKMFSERPFTGVGPGGFAARYMEYRLAVEDDHPEWLVMTRENYGEAHNDHVQILAETGIVGYALFLFLLIWVGSVSFRSTALDERARFAQRAAFPAAVAFAALAAAQFPLELAPTATTAAFAAAVFLSWSRDAARA